MTKLFLTSVFLVSSLAFAGDKQIDTTNLGLRLSDDATGELKKFASSKGKKSHKLVYGSVEIQSVVTKEEQVESLFVTFSVRNSKIKSKKADGAYEFCEGRLVPEEQESDPSDILWKLTDAGCEI